MYRLLHTLLMVWMLLAVVPIQAQSSPWLDEGDSLRSAGQYEEAQEAYERAVKADKEAIAAYLRLGSLALHMQQWGRLGDRAEDVLKRDPDHLTAHIYRGIAHREMGRLRPPGVAQLLEWPKAKKHFERVLELDSAYHDVHHQYALLEQYKGNRREALQQAFDQLRVQPELPISYVGLVRLYRLVLFRKDQKAQAWLADRGDAYSLYLEAEQRRLSGANLAAEKAYKALLDSLEDIPPTYAHLGLARLYMQWQQPDAAERHFWQAVEGISSPVEAALVFEDVRYILTNEEVLAYRSLDDAAAYRAFFRAVWTRRNPLPAAREDVRLTEHFTRLVYVEEVYAYDGFREFWNNPNPKWRLEFAEIYRLPRMFNDKGLIYLRHGPPGTTVVGDLSTWYYGPTATSPELAFHFAGIASARLIPAPMTPDAVFERSTYDAAAARAEQAYLSGDASSREMDLTMLRHDTFAESQRHVDVGLETDRHTWPERVEALIMEVGLAAFRGKNGETSVDVFYIFPMGPVAEHLSRPMKRVEIEVGLAVHDIAWNEQVKELERKAFNLTGNAGDAIIDGFSFSVRPDSYHVALHIRPQHTNLIGAVKIDEQFPDFNGTELMLSDVVPAHYIAQVERDGKFVRRGFQMVPNPLGDFARTKSVFVYFEVYNLRLQSDDLTDYVIEYTLTPKKKRRRFLFFGDKGPALTLRTEHRGETTSPAEYAEIDVRKVDTGDYTLKVTVEDRLTGEKVSRSTPVTLY